MILKAFIAVLVTVIALAAVPLTATASEPAENPMTIILIDGSSIRQSEGNIDSVRSILAMIASISTDRKVAFIDAERPSTVIGPTALGSTGFAESIAAIDSELISGNTERSDIFSGLVQANTLIGLERPASGSNVVLITSGSSDENTNSVYKRVLPLVDQLISKSNDFHVITIGSVSDTTNEFAQSLVSRSGGEYFLIQNNSEIYKAVANITSNVTNTNLEEINSSTLTLNDIVSLSVDVLPETKNLQFFVYLENSSGSISLTNPRGLDSSLIDGSYAIESPYIRSIKIDDPTPGTWLLDANSVNGKFAVWSTSQNELRLTINNSGPVPFNQPSSLVVFASRGSNLIGIEDGKIHAYVTTPEGQTLAYTLNDSGLDSDTVAGDGYFSGAVGPFNSTGIHNVTLELSWNEIEYVLTSESSIDVQHFPSLEINSLLQGDLNLSERNKVATINVNVDGQPYPVQYDDIAWDISSGDSSPGKLEIQANTASVDSQDWIYDVFMTVDSPGQRTVSFALQLEYGGQSYIYTATPLFISSIEPPAVQSVVNEDSRLDQTRLETLQTSQEFPWWVIVFPVSLAVAMLSILINWIIQARPKGFLFNDRNERVIDFANLKRGFFSKLLFKNTISGKELGMVGFESVTFKFTKGKICIESNKPSASVRVDNKPLSNKTELVDKTWIGVGGKLYSFVQ
tara:strand:- start:9597 stop:11654 length:2058 start_codon:yes stop_codon:yes gene_type:complete